MNKLNKKGIAALLAAVASGLTGVAAYLRVENPDQDAVVALITVVVAAVSAIAAVVKPTTSDQEGKPR